MQLPWRREILPDSSGRSLGFQLHSSPPISHACPSIDVGDGYRLGTRFRRPCHPRRLFPISVDCDQIVELAADPNVRARAREIREGLGNPEFLLLGVDRLDYTQGIQQRIKAIAEMLDDDFSAPSDR